MSQKEKYKICLIGDCLSGGGAEKVQALLSDFFVSKGILVHHVIVTDSVSYSFSGSLLNLGKLKNQSNNIFNKIYRLNYLHDFLKRENFDFIIDSRVKNKPFQEWFTARFIYNAPSIFMVHSGVPSYYFPKLRWLARSIHKNAYGIVSVSEGMKKLLQNQYGFSKVVTIPNPFDISEIEKASTADTGIDFEYIIAAGRMKDDVKQFDKLITSYANSELPSKGIRLVILGEGKLMADHQNLAIEKGVGEMVVFRGFEANPFPFMRQAKFLVLCSKSEGFANVIVENLACGKPVVAFDCDFGPREIITNRENGLLVNNQDFTALTLAMNTFTSDRELYDHCTSKAKMSAEKFNLEQIGKQWLEFLKID